MGCDNGDKEFQINRCISEGCNLIRWCPKNGEGLDEPSCHLRNSDSRACIYKDCDSCTKDSCDYDKDPNNDDDGNPIGHWYTYFKVKGNIFHEITLNGFSNFSPQISSFNHHVFYLLA